MTYTPAIGKLKKELFSELMLRSDGGMTVLEAGAGPGDNNSFMFQSIVVIFWVMNFRLDFW